MQRITDDELRQRIWDKIFSDYSFRPSAKKGEEWLRPKGVFHHYKIGKMWSEEQEAVVNTILCKVTEDKGRRHVMFALDWRHDCFLYNPGERIPTGFEYYDSERNCNVCFPEYYPDGDYHFFVSMDWSFGLFGHPWRKELIVAGEKLITVIEKNKEALGLERYSD